MSLQNILLFFLRAIAFAAPVTLLFCLIRALWLRRKNKAPSLKHELLYAVFCFYLSALIQITVIRSGISFDALFTQIHTTKTIQLIPLIYTLTELRRGLWAFIYPVAGNILWFIPLGLLLPRINPVFRRLLPLCLAAFSLSLSIETLQWLFGSGISDIDDILFNTFGALLPNICYAFYKMIQRKGV